jgi:phage/plasmid-like protein (TIGR03299 family)
MAHEIETNDGQVFADKAAWHGLGTVVEGAPNPFAALRIAKMEWSVLESESMVCGFDLDSQEPKRIATGSHKMLVRSDDYSILGVVGSSYSPVQNATLAELAWSFRQAGEDRGVEVESAGSIQGGRRVWMLLRSPTVDMTGCEDFATPYLMIANAHDGTMAMRVIPTSVRVVCSNTFHSAIDAAKNGWCFRHTHNISARVEELQTDISRWYANIKKGQQIATSLSSKSMSVSQSKQLWQDVLETLDGKFVTDPTNGWEERKRERGLRFLAHCHQTMHTESTKYGVTAWTAVNAATSAIQHYRAHQAIRSKDANAVNYARWDGTTADATAKAFDLVLQA